VPAGQLEQLRDDLTPLLAIRLLPDDDPAFGLTSPRLQVTITAGGRRTVVDVGNANFDRTGVYVRTGDRIALVLPRVSTTLTAIVGPP
jgi:hypothetical protein